MSLTLTEIVDARDEFWCFILPAFLCLVKIFPPISMASNKAMLVRNRPASMTRRQAPCTIPFSKYPQRNFRRRPKRPFSRCAWYSYLLSRRVADFGVERCRHLSHTVSFIPLFPPWEIYRSRWLQQQCSRTFRTRWNICHKNDDKTVKSPPKN